MVYICNPRSLFQLYEQLSVQGHLDRVDHAERLFTRCDWRRWCRVSMDSVQEDGRTTVTGSEIRLARVQSRSEVKVYGDFLPSPEKKDQIANFTLP